MGRSTDGARALSQDSEALLLAYARRGLADLQTGLRSELGVEVSRARRAAALVADAFTPESFVGFPCGPHVMGFGWGGMWLQEALDVASLLATARRATGAWEETLRRLGRAAAFMGARSELRAVRVLDERGHLVEVSKTHKAGADLRIVGARDERVEVVTFDAPPRDAGLELSLVTHLITTEPRPGDHSVDVFVALHGDRIAAIAAHQRAAERAARVLALEMADAARQLILRGEDADVDAPGIGSAAIRRWRPGPVTPGGWDVRRTSPLSTIKKVITAIHEKARQTDPGVSGDATERAGQVAHVIWVDLSSLRFHAGALGLHDLLDAMRVHARDALTAGEYEHVAGLVLYATEWIDNEVLLERLVPITVERAEQPGPGLRSLLAGATEQRRTIASLAGTLNA